MRVIVHFQFVKIEKQGQKSHLVWFYSLIFYERLFIMICYDTKLVDSLQIASIISVNQQYIIPTYVGDGHDRPAMATASGRINH